MDAAVQLYTNGANASSNRYCWPVARDLLVLDGKGGQHMRYNYCFYVGGIVDELSNVWVAEQSSSGKISKRFGLATPVTCARTRSAQVGRPTCSS